MKGIYIHIPFCIQKCNYCDFCSYPSLMNMRGEYCDALCREAESYKEMHISADTVYFGGGTPSVLECGDISRVMESVRKNFDISPNAEITIEVNPGTVTLQDAKLLRSIGFNRVSIGAQSFDSGELSLLGRIHTPDDTIRCFNYFCDTGFDNISLDLMYAIPGQNMKSLSTSVLQVLKLAPEHISCYGLKIEEGTPFERMLSNGEICEKSDDEYADMYDFIRSECASNGYAQYELSNFSKPGFESRHNLKYWLSGEYAGLGAAASSYLGTKRFTHSSDIREYMNSFSNEEEYELSIDDMMSEFMFLSLRLTSIGTSKADFAKKFGVQIEDVFGNSIKKHLSLGTLKDEGDRYVLSPKAYYISNSVLCDFV